MIFCKSNKFFKSRGFGIIEAIVGIAISAILLIVFIELIAQNIKINTRNISELKAQLYLQEMIEVAKDLEQSNWSELIKPECDASLNNICHPAPSGTVWTLAPNEEPLDNNNYHRSLAIEGVFRSSATYPNEIVLSTTPGAVPDPNTKKVTATITWRDNFQTNNTNTSTLEIYVYKYQQ